MSDQRYDDEFLRRLRNDIPIAQLIQHLAGPAKCAREGSCFSAPAARKPNRPSIHAPTWDVASTAKPTSIRSTSRSVPGDATSARGGAPHDVAAPLTTTSRSTSQGPAHHRSFLLAHRTLPPIT